MNILFRGKDLPSNRCSGVAAAVWLVCVISLGKYCNIIYINIIMTLITILTMTKSQYFRVSLGFTWNSHVGREYSSQMALNRKRYIMVYMYMPIAYNIIVIDERACLNSWFCLTHSHSYCFYNFRRVALLSRWHTISP